MTEPSGPRDDVPEAGPGPARWQKIAGIVGLLVLLGLGVLVFAGGGHGPARHLPGSETPPAVGDE